MAENSGLNPINSVTSAKANQVSEKFPFYGIDCLSRGTNDMKSQKIYETLLSKKQQIQLATQVVKMILKVDDVIEPDNYE